MEKETKTLTEETEGDESKKEQSEKKPQTTSTSRANLAAACAAKAKKVEEKYVIEGEASEEKRITRKDTNKGHGPMAGAQMVIPMGDPELLKKLKERKNKMEGS